MPLFTGRRKEELVTVHKAWKITN